MAIDGAALERAIRRARRRLEAVEQRLGAIDPAHLTADDWLEARAHVGNLVADFNASVSDIDRLLEMTGAQGRILRYLQLRLGEKVSKDELSGVAGIYEWARRVRELRQDHGWAIHSSVTRDDLRVGEYRLESTTPNEDFARDWETARRISRLRTSGGVLPPRVRVLEFLRAIFPRAADREQLAYVAGSASRASEALDALTREGWRIVHADQDDKLAPGECRLMTIEN